MSRIDLAAVARLGSNLRVALRETTHYHPTKLLDQTRRRGMLVSRGTDNSVRCHSGQSTEFAGIRTPDDNRLFTELYGVQRLPSNTIGSSSKVVISTIQRLYSILKGEPELDPEAEEHSDLDGGPEPKEPMPVVYNPAVPPEFFDVILIDQCHGRSTRSGVRCWNTSTPI